MNRLFAALTGLAALSCATPSENVDPAAKADVPAVARDDNQFALDLYAQLRGQDGNLFFSPYSISTALAMTRAGARGDTAGEMDKVLHFTLPQDKLNPAFAALIKQINGDPATYEARLPAQHRQRPVGAKGLRLQGRLPQANQGRLRRRAERGGFQDRGTKQARQTINAWVEKQTHDKIKDLLHQGDLDRATRGWC